MKVIRKVKMPEERLPVLIGAKGKTKKELEKRTNTKIYIEDDITIEGESLDVLTAENIIKAIARGFSPENAFQLTDEEFTLDLLELPKEEKLLIRYRSRLIGTKGKCRRNLELLTKTKISIYGKTVGIIGKYENVELVENAIRKLMNGFSHRSVYEYLEKHQDKIKHVEQED